MRRLYLSVVLLMAGCASNPVTVIESTSNHSAPAWTERQTFEEGGKTQFVGAAALESGSATACFIVADEKALSEAGRNLVNSFLDQAAVVEGNDEPSVRRTISSLRSERPAVEGLSIIDRYSQLVRVESQGYSRVERRCWSLAAAPTRNVQSAVQALARKLRGSTNHDDLDEITRQQREATLKK